MTSFAIFANMKTQIQHFLQFSFCHVYDKIYSKQAKNLFRRKNVAKSREENMKKLKLCFAAVFACAIIAASVFAFSAPARADEALKPVDVYLLMG